MRQFEKASVPDALKAALPSDTNVLDLITRQNWQRDRLGRQARGFKHADLARCFTAIARADAMLKGIEGDIEDARLIMELWSWNWRGLRGEGFGRCLPCGRGRTDGPCA